MKFFMTLMVVLAAVLGNGCVLDQKLVDVVVTGEVCAEFIESHASADYSTPVTLDYSGEIDGILADNGLSRGDIKSATLVSASYEVTRFTHPHDWLISGTVTVRRTDVDAGPAVLIGYDSVSVDGARGARTGANLDPGGVALINQALADFIAGQNPGIELVVQSGGVEPIPTPADRIEFSWLACMIVQVVFEEQVDVPDPF